MGIREPIPPLLRGRPGVVDLEDVGRRLLLEPFARIALVDAATRREFARRRRPAVAQGPVQAEPVAHVDGDHVHHPDGRFEEATDERVGRPLGGRGAIDRGRHRVSLSRFGCRHCARGEAAWPTA